MKEFELVGVLAYSSEKNGVDAGDGLNIGHTGIKMTTDVDAILKVDCDCVLHVARDYGNYGSNDELVRILESGKNVITVHPFQHMASLNKTVCPPGMADRIKKACEKGGSTFHSTGLHPDFICNRLTGTLTGLCTDIESIKVEENWDVSHVNPHHLAIIGFGAVPEEAQKMFAVLTQSDNYCVQNLYGLAQTLGIKLDRAEVEHDYVTAPKDLHFHGMDVGKGTVGRLTHRWKGYREASDTKPFLLIEINWMMGRAEMLPEGMDPDHYYVALVEGKPSLKLALGIKASLARNQQLMIPGDPSSEPGYYAVIATLLQAVPMVSAAPAGILDVSRPQLRWMPDFRNLATSL
eukprot:TRINITY_DN7105_c0_g1_i4.p1 TRINITY_DN7105_c0_g1~~TRINITY_DN7105_c0_g1_i4.p1  ORF type:complete len:349 (+),score=54.67 TRINITY_DN7105_c0_g1_i4:810-1856(+)